MRSHERVDRMLRAAKSLARRSRDLSRRLLLGLDPTPRLVAQALPPTQPIVGLCVYRARNARRVQSMTRQLVSAGHEVRLWALDRADPGLGRWTVGVGAGGRFENLNRLVDTGAVRDRYLLVFDDDVTISRGSIQQVIEVTRALDLDLTQPAHGVGSDFYFDLTRRRALCVARETSFVEIGPMLVIAPGAQDHVLPFPTRSPMGWGSEVLWNDLHRAGTIRLGIVDAVEIHHHGAPAASYTALIAGERQAAREMLDERGWRGWSDLQQVTQTFRPWRAVWRSRSNRVASP